MKEKIQIICLSVFFAVITVTSVISLQKYQAYYGIIEYSKMCGFDDNTLFYFGYVPSENIILLRDAPSVKSVTAISNLSISFVKHEKDMYCCYESILFHQRDGIENEIYPIKTTDGKYITHLENDEILISSNASDKYSINDIIKSDTNGYEFIIKGFVDPDEFVPSHGCSYLSLDQAISRFNDENIQRGLLDKKTGRDLNSETYQFVCGNIYEVIGYKDDLYFRNLIVQLNEGYSRDDFYMDSSGLLNDRLSNTLTYDELKQKYIIDYYDEIGYALSYLISSFILMTVLVIGIFLNWYSKKKEELIIYYMLGLTWKKCIFYSLLPYLFSIIVGFILGIGILYRYYSQLYLCRNALSYKSNLMILLGMIVLYILICIPYYLISVRRDPIYMYQTKE